MVLNPIAIVHVSDTGTVYTPEDNHIRHNNTKRLAVKELHRTSYDEDKQPDYLDTTEVYEAYIGDTTALVPVEDVCDITKFGDFNAGGQ